MKFVKLSLIAMICFVVFISGCANESKTSNNTSSSNVTSSVKISDPVNGQTVPKIYTAKGTVSLKPGEKLYILAKCGNYTWWVQDQPIISDGKWECKIQLGEDYDSGKEFTICALITTKTLTPKKEYGGALPDFISKHEVTVKRS